MNKSLDAALHLLQIHPLASAIILTKEGKAGLLDLFNKDSGYKELYLSGYNVGDTGLKVKVDPFMPDDWAGVETTDSFIMGRLEDGNLKGFSINKVTPNFPNKLPTQFLTRFDYLTNFFGSAM